MGVPMFGRFRLGLSGPVLLFLSGTLLPPLPALAQVPRGFASAWAEVSSELRDTLEATGMVGASWAFLLDGRLISHETFGFADLETGRAVDASTIYHWGSITKTLTGIAILQLRDQGLLKLDDPIVSFVPELRAVHNPYGSMDGITIRHLLSHSSGFRNPTWPWGGGEDWHPHEPTQWNQIVSMLPYTEILFKPGTRFSYSNPGIIFLGQVIERTTGEDWEVYVWKNILSPLEMGRSYFDRTPAYLLPFRSNNYSVREGVPHPNGLDFDTGITVSNGGLNAPFQDMARFLAFLVNSGSPAELERYQTVLSRGSLEEMWEEVVPIGETGSLREAMGLCFFLEDFRGLRVIGHTGSQKAFFSFLYFDPETKTGALAAFNSNGVGGPPPPRPATRQILNGLRAALFEKVFPLF